MTSLAFDSQPVSAYIPCYNNARTLELTIQGIQSQTHPVDELFVVDDGSTDNSAAIAEGLGVRVLRLGQNNGRGAVRAQAMETARNEFVLCCDATNQLSENFLKIALEWFSSEKVVGVYGRLCDRNAQSAIDRWRARHLFQQDISYKIVRQSDLSTYGALVRKSVVLKVGNYNRLLRHGEDFDLGVRLNALGDVIFDPALEVEAVARNTLFQVMERYTRWNRSTIKAYTLSHFIDSHILAWKILIPRDLKNGDWAAALISATMPYFSIAYADQRSFRFSNKPAPSETNPLQSKS